MTEVRVPPQDIAAEQAVLGALLIAPKAYETVRALISDEDWYRPQHESIWMAMNVLAAREEAIDAVTVSAELASAGLLNRIGGAAYLVDLVSGVVTAANVGWHTEIVVDKAIRRRLVEAATRVAQYAYDGEDTLPELLVKTQAEMDLVGGLRNSDGPIPGLATWHDFLAEHAGKPGNWVIPGLLARKDVWMVLAPAGTGKTTMSRQLCWAAAAGVHPFHPGLSIEPKRSLLIDLENDEGMAADESVDFFGRYDSLGAGVGDRGWIWSRPQGINIRKAEDAALLDAVITKANPDVVAFGSLYKSFVRSGDWDQSAGEARAVLDRMRAKHQIAFWIEHHMPKANDGGRKQTPFGSSMWEWWTSHGRVLERTHDHPKAPFRFSAPFRGDRGKRECPVGFTRGGPIPWNPVWDDEELEYLIREAA